MGGNSLSVGISSSIEDKKEYLKTRGWFPWYNEDYWCHPSRKPYAYCDCTNWGSSLEDAFMHEYWGKPKQEF